MGAGSEFGRLKQEMHNHLQALVERKQGGCVANDSFIEDDDGEHAGRGMSV